MNTNNRPGLRIRLLIALLLAGCGTAYADDWSVADKQRQRAYLTLHVIDWAQTRYIARHPDYYETNGLLGRNPSIGDVDRYFLVTGVLHLGIAHWLSPRWRRRFQYVTIGVQAGFVARNHSIGIRLDF